MAGIFKINNNEIIDSSGKLTSAAFPTGTVIQTDTATYGPTSATTVTTSSDDYLTNELEVSITPKANGNKLFITAFIPDVYNNASANRGLYAGFAYDGTFGSGNGTTIGSKEFIASFHGYIGTSTTLLTNLQYSTVVTVGTNAPSAGSASIIRPIFKSDGGDITINQYASSSREVNFLMVMEIQQ